MKRKLLIIIFAFFWLAGAVYGQEETSVYSTALQNAHSGNSHTAFIYFSSFLRNYPESKYRKQSLFAIGEYYFSIGDYPDAAATFTQFIEDYPDSKEEIFVLVYLLKIAERFKEEPLIEKIKKEIITHKQTGFVFRDFKEQKYRSPFFRKYRVIYTIDKITFSIDGEPFEEISY